MPSATQFQLIARHCIGIEYSADNDRIAIRSSVRHGLMREIPRAKGKLRFSAARRSGVSSCEPIRPPSGNNAPAANPTRS